MNEVKETSFQKNKLAEENQILEIEEGAHIYFDQEENQSLHTSREENSSEFKLPTLQITSEPRLIGGLYSPIQHKVTIQLDNISQSKVTHPGKEKTVRSDHYMTVSSNPQESTDTNLREKQTREPLIISVSW